eukprot:809994_1
MDDLLETIPIIKQQTHGVFTAIICAYCRHLFIIHTVGLGNIFLVLDVPSVLFKLETYQNIIIVTLVNKKQTYRSLTSVPLDQYDMNSEIYQNFLSIDYEMIENKCHRCIDFGRFKKK